MDIWSQCVFKCLYITDLLTAVWLGGGLSKELKSTRLPWLEPVGVTHYLPGKEEKHHRKKKI